MPSADRPGMTERTWTSSATSNDCEPVGMKDTIITLTIGGQQLRVYHATTPRDWQQGLVGRNLVGCDGMLFAFGADVRNPFHMATLVIPIVVAFFSAGRQLVDVTYLAPGSDPYQPSQPYRYALELIGRYASAEGAMHLLSHLDGVKLP